MRSGGGTLVTAMSLKDTARSALGVRTLTLGALASVVFVSTYSLFSEPRQDQAAGATPTTLNGHAPASFTAADAGACLNWDTDDAGTPTNFEQTPCNEPHRFEVSSREDLATYPSSEFGEDAPRPDVTRQAQLREELCRNATLTYLEGGLDPSGRFSVASILPPAPSWDQGDRTLLCGMQSTDSAGTPVLTEGQVAEVDQARVAKPGSCLMIDHSNSLHPVDCAADHQLEATSIVDLKDELGPEAPSVEDQDDFLKEACTQAAIDHLGEEEKLYQSTLQPFWLPLSAESWASGSHSVNCALMSAADEGFDTLNGSATGEFTINGEPPPEQPKRNPLRSERENQGQDQQGGRAGAPTAGGN